MSREDRAGPDRSDRFGEVDLIKAIGAILVVMIHSLRTPWDSGISVPETILGHATRFVVPGFLAASGFLYATTEPIPASRTRRRLMRLLVPYLVASLFAQLCFLFGVLPVEFGPAWKDLILCSSFGPYYYVLVIAAFVLVSPLLRYVPPGLLPPFLALLLVLQYMWETTIFPFTGLFWHVRNPVYWAGFFVLGWCSRLYYEPLARFVRPRKWQLMPLLGLAFLAAVLPTASSESRLLVGTLEWLGIFLALAFLFVAGVGRRMPAGIVFLSMSSYAIYLFHLFILKPMLPRVPLQPGVFELHKLLLPWTISLLGTLALVWAARKVLGPRARTWLGA